MNKKEQQLLEYYQRLPTEQAETLLAYAEFMAGRYGQDEEIPAEIQPIPRPEKESVIAAIKRLSATYPMLDKGKIFTETSSLMSQHIIQGREAMEVIDELEDLFVREYTDFLNDRDEL